MHLLIIALILLSLVFGPSLWVQHVLRKYSNPADRYSFTGGEFARRLLDEQGLGHVTTEATQLGDHYDPLEKVVRLTEDKFNGKSLTAITVAAHEVGHAIQDQTLYGPLRLRTQIVRLTVPVQKLGAGVLMAAPFLVFLTRAPSVGVFMFVGGLLSLGTAAVVHLVTLPTEFDASFSRALPLLKKGEYLHKTDFGHARRLLMAAALTYVSASLMSLLNIGRWFAILRR